MVLPTTIGAMRVSVSLQQIVDLMCLVYHEARNVRHPIKAGSVDASKYKKIVSLPTNRNDAWQAMDALRRHAIDSGNVGAARKIFESFFGLDLQDLAALYALPIWKHSAIGGNQWASITSKVCDLVSVAGSDARPKVEDLYREIGSMRHNTGRVDDKLRQLKICRC